MPRRTAVIFIRKPQLQCRDYLVAGPYKELKKYKAGDWNEIVVEVKGRVAQCTCNGEVLEAEFKLPPSGPIGLEGDRGQMELPTDSVEEKLGLRNKSKAFRYFFRSWWLASAKALPIWPRILAEPL